MWSLLVLLRTLRLFLGILSSILPRFNGMLNFLSILRTSYRIKSRRPILLEFFVTKMIMTGSLGCSPDVKIIKSLSHSVLEALYNYDFFIFYHITWFLYILLELHPWWWWWWWYYLWRFPALDHSYHLLDLGSEAANTIIIFRRWA